MHKFLLMMRNVLLIAAFHSFAIAASFDDIPGNTEQAVDSSRFGGYAPALAWGGWQTIAQHCGRIGYRINYKAKRDDTSVYAEVRYWKAPNLQVTEGFIGSTSIIAGQVCGSIEIRFKGVPWGSALEGVIN